MKHTKIKNYVYSLVDLMVIAKNTSCEMVEYHFSYIVDTSKIIYVFKKFD